MNEEEKFDELIRSRFSEKEFLFDEENWEKAEAIITSQRRSQKFIKWAGIFMIGLFSGIGIMLPFVLHENRDDSKNIAEVSNVEKNETTVSSVSKGEISNIHSDHIISKPSEISIHNERPEEINIKQNDSDRGQNILTNRNVQDDMKEKLTENKQNTKVNDTENHTTEFAENSVQEKGSENPKTEISNEPSLSLIQNPANDTLPLSLETNGIPVGIKQPTSDSVIENKEAPVQTTASIKPKSDSATGATPNNALEMQPKPTIATANIFSIEAGTNYVFGWNHNDTTEARGFNPVLGLSAAHFFNTKWTVQSGIHYGSIRQLKESRISSDIKYDFGYSSADTVIIPKTLHYFVLPLRVIYSINNKNSIGIGGSVSYLFNTTSKVITYTDNNSAITDKSEKNAFGYMQGFNQWDASLAVIYRRRITDKLAAGGKGDFGLMDIKDGGTQRERNISLSIFLSYDLFNW